MMSPSLEIGRSADPTSEDLMVVKSNHLIEAKYKLTHSEQRLVLYIIAHVNPHASLFNDIYLTTPQMSRIVQKNITFSEAEKLIEGLYRQEIDILDPETRNRKLMRWVSVAEFNPKKGLARLSFDNEMKPYLLGLKERFTANSLNQVLQLKSAYSIRLYELLSTVRHLRKKSRNFDYVELRAVLGVNEDYDWYDFKRWVLEPAKKELKESTDVSFTYKEERVSRKVKSVKFNIQFDLTQQRGQEGPVGPLDVAGDQELLDWQVKILGRATSGPFFMNPSIVEKLLYTKDWPRAYWKWLLDKQERSMKGVQNPGGATYDALHSQYHLWEQIQQTKKDEASRERSRESSPELAIFEPATPDKDPYATEVWRKIFDALEEESSQAAAKLENARAIRLSGNTVTLWVANQIVQHLVENHYRAILEKVSHPYKVEIIAPKPQD